MNVTLWVEGEAFRLKLEEGKPGFFRISLNDRTHDVSAEFINPEEVLLNVDGRVFNVTINSGAEAHSVFVNGHAFQVARKASSGMEEQERGRAKKKEVSASMPGRVAQVLAAEGDEVREGQPVLVLEAMKMQNEIKAPRSGILRRLSVRAGATVEAGAMLFAVE
ncbi:MAG: hypothetical protein A2Y86_03030 [Candidatus Aminicenantes bacterium RBG_13_62_12]|nr:MAG: hypothetical protein A2Y86_03030 [Candidatus Aminicenantes bacterium RBG_13_62_12]